MKEIKGNYSVNAEGKIIPSATKRKKGFLQTWGWFLGQCLLIVYYRYVHTILGIRHGWPLYVPAPVAWLLLYVQLRSYRWRGAAFIYPENSFTRWEIIRLGGVAIFGLIYRRLPLLEGEEEYWYYPFVASNWKFITVLKVIGIRFQVQIGLIR